MNKIFVIITVESTTLSHYWRNCCIYKRYYRKCGNYIYLCTQIFR